MEKEYKICTHCVMDTSDPEISFDENGVCCYCRKHKKNEVFLHTEDELKLEVEKMKRAGDGKQYDCIIGLSGGVDSSVVAYWVKKLGLRPLAVHLDNGWNTELSYANIENIVKGLNIDFYTHVIDWEEFKDLQLSFLRASVANIEIPTDHAIVALLYQTAAKFGVEYIIHGGNISSESIMPPAWGYDAKDLKHINAIHKRFGKIKLKTFPKLGIWKLSYYNLVKKIKYFPLLDYIDYNKEQEKEFLKNELGWRNYGGKHEESLFTKFFQNYILIKKFNIDKRRAHYASLINAGQITREEALKILESNPYSNEKEMSEDKGYVIKKLGLSETEFDAIMNQPIKTYRDYPNHSLFTKKLVFIYRFLKKIMK